MPKRADCESDMSTHVTERDMRRFASLGFPASVCASQETDPDSLVQSALHVLQAPSARLAGAVMLVLEALAATDNLEPVVRRLELDDDVRRRLGYLAERLSQTSSTPDPIAERLADVAGNLADPNDSSRPPLTFMAKTTPSLLRLKMRRADETSRRWNVYGDVEVPGRPVTR